MSKHNQKPLYRWKPTMLNLQNLDAKDQQQVLETFENRKGPIYLNVPGPKGFWVARRNNSKKYIEVIWLSDEEYKPWTDKTHDDFTEGYDYVGKSEGYDSSESE